jgi:hypothetical protein
MPTARKRAIARDRFRWNIDLLGVKNGVNNVFTTPEDFEQVGNLVISIYWNGRRLKLNGDYTVAESGGVGTGYDQVTFLFSKSPVSSSILTADYIAA